jgi:hypothetical protein
MSRSRSPTSRSDRLARIVSIGCWCFALLLLFAAGAKLTYPTPLANTLTHRFELSEQASSIVGPALVGYEILLAGLLLLAPVRTVALWALAATMAVFLGASIALGFSDAPAPCGCFGGISLPAMLGFTDEQIAIWEIARNALLVTAACTLVILHTRQPSRAQATA